MGRILSQRTFQPTQSIRIECISEKTSMAFRHLATIYRNNLQVGFARIPYQNRTWESYEFQSVMQKAVDSSYLTPEEKTAVNKWLQGDRTDWSGFHTIGAIAKMGDIISRTPQEANVWKTRMLKAGFGEALDIPADWEKLPETERGARLDKVIGLISATGKKKKLKSQIKSSGLDVAKETKVWN